MLKAINIAERIAESAIQMTPMPIQKSVGYMQINSEVDENVQLPSANRIWCIVTKSPLKSTIIQIARARNIKRVAMPLCRSMVATRLLPDIIAATNNTTSVAISKTTKSQVITLNIGVHSLRCEIMFVSRLLGSTPIFVSSVDNCSWLMLPTEKSLVTTPAPTSCSFEYIEFCESLVRLHSPLVMKGKLMQAARPDRRSIAIIASRESDFGITKSKS